MHQFRKIGLIAKTQHPGASNTLQALIYYLREREHTPLLHSASVDALPRHGLPIANTEELGQHCDLVITIGGDGTLLQAARWLARFESRLVGINLGRLGFLADIHPSNMTEHLDSILGGHFSEEKRFLLRAAAYRGETCLNQGSAFNDVVIQKWNTAHMFSFTTRINGHLLGSQRSDGFLIATPTGSTAYCLSGGGPILHPAINALVLLSMFPHTLSNPPIVVDGDSEIEVTISIEQQAQAQLTCDAVLCQTLLPGDRVLIRKHRHIYLVHPPGHDHYATLRGKLHWGREP